MQMISFESFRSSGIRDIRNIKPENWMRHLDEIKAADWLLFPEYWQVNTLVYALHKKIFPNISTFHLGHDKIESTRAIQAAFPLNMPETLILPNTDSAQERILDTFYFPFVAKKVRSSMGKGVYLINDRADLEKYLSENDILYIQEYLPIKKDLRVVFVGDRVITAYWRCAADGAFHNNVAQGGSISYENIPQGAIELVTDMAKSLSINHAGFDIAEIDGHFYFFEINVYFGNQAINELKLDMPSIITEYLTQN